MKLISNLSIVASLLLSNASIAEEHRPVAAPYEENESKHGTILLTVKFNIPKDVYKIIYGNDTRYGLFAREGNKAKAEMRNQGHTNQAMEWVIQDHPNPGQCPDGGKIIKSNSNGQYLAREYDRASQRYNPVLKDQSDFGDGYYACWSIHRFITTSNQLGDVAIFSQETDSYSRQYLANRDGNTVLVNPDDSDFDIDSINWEFFKAGPVVKHNTRATIEATAGRVITVRESGADVVLEPNTAGSTYQSFFLRPHDNGTFVFESVKPKRALVVPGGNIIQSYHELGYVSDDGRWFIDQKMDGRYVISNLEHPGVMTDSSTVSIYLNGYSNSNGKQEWYIWQ